MGARIISTHPTFDDLDQVQDRLAGQFDQIDRHLQDISRTLDQIHADLVSIHTTLDATHQSVQSARKWLIACFLLLCGQLVLNLFVLFGGL